MNKRLHITTLLLLIGAVNLIAQQPPELVDTPQRPYVKGIDQSVPSPHKTAETELRLSDKIAPITPDNIFRDPDYYNWCSSIIKGEDGRYHMFYSRWERSKTFDAWLTHSKVAHAVADRPEGPYKYVKTVIDLDKKHYKAGDMITAHNPKIKHFNGKYYLYFCSTAMERDVTEKEMIETAKTGNSHPNWQPLRVNQRTFVASASSLDGEWTIDKKPLLEPTGPIETLVVNPAITQGPDKRYYLIIKGDKPGTTKFERNQAVAVSNYPDRDFKIQPQPVIQDWDTEDVSMWYDQPTAHFYAVFHAHTYIGMMTSTDGINWQKAADFTVMNKCIQQANGQPAIIPDRMERPFVFDENNEPRVLSFAVKKGNDTYIVTLPFCAQSTDNLNLSARIQPADPALFVRDSTYYNWCNSIIKDDNGTYHLFYSRWPKSIGFYSWLTHSEIAHATAIKPEGPYRMGQTVLKARKGYWDSVTAHNVKVEKFDNQYYMYYTSTNTGDKQISEQELVETGKTGYSHANWLLLRTNQRTGVATSKSLNDTWKQFSQPMIEPHGPIKNVTVNPAVCQGQDNRYYLIIKGDDVNAEKPRVIQAIGTSDRPDEGFKLENNPAFADIPTEDVSMWYDKSRKRYYAIFHAHGSNFIGLITSVDGLNWQKAQHYEVCKKEVPLNNGTIMKVDRMERPFVFVEDGKPVLLSFGVKKENDAFIVFFPLRGES